MPMALVSAAVGMAKRLHEWRESRTTSTRILGSRRISYMLPLFSRILELHPYAIATLPVRRQCGC
jgi:hypothetical protein